MEKNSNLKEKKIKDYKVYKKNFFREAISRFDDLRHKD